MAIQVISLKYEEDPIKMALEWPQHKILIFSHSQGQITLQSRVESGRNSNSSEMLWLSLLLTSMKKIQ